MDTALVTQIVSGAVAIFTTAMSLWSRHKAKVLEADVNNTNALIQSVTGRTTAMEFQLNAAARREGELTAEVRALQRQLYERDSEIGMLKERLESMKLDYTGLLDKYNSAVKALVGDFNNGFKTAPPPSPYSRLPRPPRLPK